MQGAGHIVTVDPSAQLFEQKRCAVCRRYLIERRPPAPTPSATGWFGCKFSSQLKSWKISLNRQDSIKLSPKFSTQQQMSVVQLYLSYSLREKVFSLLNGTSNTHWWDSRNPRNGDSQG